MPEIWQASYISSYLLFNKRIALDKKLKFRKGNCSPFCKQFCFVAIAYSKLKLFTTVGNVIVKIPSEYGEIAERTEGEGRLDSD